MELIYQLTQKDFFDSFVAHRNRTRVTKWSVRLMLVFVFLLLGIGIVSLAASPSVSSFKRVAPLFLIVAMWILLIWVAPWRAARNQFSKQPSAKGPVTLVVDNAGVRWRWDGGSADLEWRNFVRLVESEKVFLIYSSPFYFNIVPKRTLAPAQVSELREILQQNLSVNR